MTLPFNTQALTLLKLMALPQSGAGEPAPSWKADDASYDMAMQRVLNEARDAEVSQLANREHVWRALIAATLTDETESKNMSGAAFASSNGSGVFMSGMGPAKRDTVLSEAEPSEPGWFTAPQTPLSPATRPTSRLDAAAPEYIAGVPMASTPRRASRKSSSFAPSPSRPPRAQSGPGRRNPFYRDAPASDPFLDIDSTALSPISSPVASPFLTPAGSPATSRRSSMGDGKTLEERRTVASVIARCIIPFPAFVLEDSLRRGLICVI